MSRIRAGIKQVVGLPVAATVVMFGVVFLANGGLYGWPGTIGGTALVALGTWAGWKIHVSARERLPDADPDSRHGETSS